MIKYPLEAGSLNPSYLPINLGSIPSIRYSCLTALFNLRVAVFTKNMWFQPNLPIESYQFSYSNIAMFELNYGFPWGSVPLSTDPHMDDSYARPTGWVSPEQ